MYLYSWPPPGQVHHTPRTPEPRPPARARPRGCRNLGPSRPRAEAAAAGHRPRPSAGASVWAARWAAAARPRRPGPARPRSPRGPPSSWRAAGAGPGPGTCCAASPCTQLILRTLQFAYTPFYTTVRLTTAKVVQHPHVCPVHKLQYILYFCSHPFHLI